MSRFAAFLTACVLLAVLGGCRYSGWIGPRTDDRGLEWGHELQTDVHLAYDPTETAPSDPEVASP